MFIWFVFRDCAGNPWQSGLDRFAGAAHKPAFDAFGVAGAADRRPSLDGERGTRAALTMYVPYLATTREPAR